MANNIPPQCKAGAKVMVKFKHISEIEAIRQYGSNVDKVYIPGVVIGAKKELAKVVQVWKIKIR